MNVDCMSLMLLAAETGSCLRPCSCFTAAIFQQVLPLSLIPNKSLVSYTHLIRKVLRIFIFVVREPRKLCLYGLTKLSWMELYVCVSLRELSRLNVHRDITIDVWVSRTENFTLWCRIDEQKPAHENTVRAFLQVMRAIHSLLKTLK